MENGSQSAIYLLDLLILIFVLSTLIKYTIKSFNNNNEKFFDSLIFGFMIWFFIYFVSQINTVINFEIIRIFGLNEPIDTIFTTQPDGLNWRGVTPSHELTGLWLLIITCCSINMFLKTKKVYFILTLALNLIALSWNSQRTPLILLFLFIIYIVFSYRFINLRAVLTIITVVGITFVIFDSGIDRLTDRISRISPTYELEHGTYWELGQSLKRFEKFDIDTKQPDYDFRSLNGYDEFYQKELGIKNSTLLRTMNFTAKAFGRQIQWSRFIYLNDMEGKDFIFGKGPGQSNEVLVQLIEKPHSLYFTVYYQYGIFGILLLLSLILSVFHKIKLYSLRPEYLMCLFFFVIGLKSEFVMTHNQIVFFIVFVSFTLSSRK